MGRIRRAKHGPEWFIQRDLIIFLRARKWHVERMIGNALQKGIPDLYAYRRDVGERWIDVKNPKRFTFTREQKLKWPIWERVGVDIWILTAANQEEYDKLFKPPNMRDYWNPKWDSAPDLDKLLDEISGDFE